MTTLPDFRLETHFSRWEFKAKHHMTASDAETMTQALNDHLEVQVRAHMEQWLWVHRRWKDVKGG